MPRTVARRIASDPVGAIPTSLDSHRRHGLRIWHRSSQRTTKAKHPPCEEGATGFGNPSGASNRRTGFEQTSSATLAVTRMALHETSNLVQPGQPPDDARHQEAKHQVRTYDLTP